MEKLQSIDLEQIKRGEFRGIAVALYRYINKNFCEPSSHKYAPDNQTISKIVGLATTSISNLYSGGPGTAKTKRAHLKRILDVFKIKISGTIDSPEFHILKPLEDKDLEKLAIKLAANLIDVSTTFQEGDHPHNQILENPKLFDKVREYRKRERFILITGAGASHAATKGVMPLSKQAVDTIDEELKGQEVLRELIQQEIEDIGLSTRLDTSKFETKLLAYSKYARHKVISGLQKMCGPKHVPNLVYEVLSHILKHRFVDVAFNFNFDELFDNSLKEEIENGEFKYIFTEGQAPIEEEFRREFFINKRLKHPIYIKPHGTISHISSLRFARERRAKLPREIKETMSKLINAEVFDPESEQDQLRVNFIIVGFGLSSPDLLHILEQGYKDKLSKEPPFFWIFDKKTRIRDFEELNSQRYSTLIKENCRIFVIDEDDSLEDYLVALWKLIEKSFKPEFRPIGIERHLLINKIFSCNEREISQRNQPENIIEYLRDRIWVETVIAFLSSDGIVNFGQLSEGRIAHYIRLLNEISGSHQLLDIRDVCKQIGLDVYKGFVSDVFTLKHHQEFHAEDIVENYVNKLDSYLSRKRGKFLVQNREEIISLLNIIKNRTRLKITPQFQLPHKGIFQNLVDENILFTGLAWLYRYKSFLKKTSEWNLVLAISEKGRFLSESTIDLFTDKKIGLVLSSFDFPKSIPFHSEVDLADYSILFGNEVYLPWWLHNKHMVLFLKRKSNTQHENEIENWILKDGFYYESRLLSRKVNPIHLTGEKHEENKLYLLETFANYWYRANVYTQQVLSGEPRSIPIIKDKEELYGYIKKILKEYYK